MEKTIYIIIPVYNRRETTKSCLTSLYEYKDENIRVIVVDDGSSDGTSEMISENFPQTILLKGDGNLWWTGATRVGVEKAIELGQSTDLVLLLNDDLIIKSDYFETLRDVHNKNPDALIGSVVLPINEPDRIINGGAYVNWWTAKLVSLNENRNISEFPEGYLQDVSYLTGRGVLIPIKVFQSIGLHDDEHFKQCGDTELPVRAAHHGYKLYVSYDLRAYSFPESDANINRKPSYQLKEFRKYFFDFRSNMSFECRFWLAQKMIPNVFQRYVYLTFDLSRIFIRYLVNLRFN